MSHELLVMALRIVGALLIGGLIGLGACPSSGWIFLGESDSVQGYEQAFPPLEDRRQKLRFAECAGLCG
jgi:hypothetical protein